MKVYHGSTVEVKEPDFKVLKFDTDFGRGFYTTIWFLFVYQNRRSNDLIHDYDIVIGPVSEDNVYKTLNFYDSGEFTMEEAIKRLKTDLLSNQISFHTEKSLKCLKYLGTVEIDDKGENYD